MTNQTCSTCKHWYSDADQMVIKSGRGICLMTTSTSTPVELVTPRDEASQAIATVMVVSTFGYRLALGQLETTENFGCNQWTEGVA
jgi:hypothetical protein